MTLKKDHLSKKNCPPFNQKHCYPLSKIKLFPLQRCYVMAKYDVALKVSVSPEDYPKTLAHIYDRKAIVLLVVDLLDFPGSVWPGIIDLLGVNKHIVIVGNKADLLPQVRQFYIPKIKNTNPCKPNAPGNFIGICSLPSTGRPM